jgi:hypothetical protein
VAPKFSRSEAEPVEETPQPEAQPQEPVEIILDEYVRNKYGTLAAGLYRTKNGNLLRSH